jgi:mono/diheme cytochrome c family protein
MKKLIYTFLAIFLFLGVSFSWYKCTFNKTKAEVLQENIGEAEKYYEEYCASCHGKQVKEFVNREKWVYGSSRKEMFDVVKNGAEKDGMPAYGEVLSL